MKYLALTILDPNASPNVSPITVSAPPGVQTTPDIIGNVPQFIVTILITFVIVASLIMIIYSGIQWITSGGDEKKIEGARGRLTYSIIGLVVALTSALIVGLTIQLLGGNPNMFNIGNFTPFTGANNQNVQNQFDNRNQHTGTDITPAPSSRCHWRLGTWWCDTGSSGGGR